MPGMVIKYEKNVGDSVNEGETVVVIEAMKMENELRAHIDGIVKTLHVAPGDAVVKNALLVEFEG